MKTKHTKSKKPTAPAQAGAVRDGAAETRLKFTAMPNGVLSKTQAETAGRELLRIQREHGCVKPAIVVEESRPKAAALHGHFTWDDAAAAEKCRCDEARAIIRSVRVVRDNGVPEPEQEVVRAFVHVTAHTEEENFDGAGYISFSRAVSDARYREQMMMAAKAEISAWERRYADMIQFMGIKPQVEALTAALETP